MGYPAGAAYAFNMQEIEQENYCRESVLLEREIQDTYEDAVSKFYSCSVTFKTAEALAKLWARSWIDNEWEDEAAAHISDEMGIGNKEAFAILKMRKELIKEIENEKSINWYWR